MTDTLIPTDLVAPIFNPATFADRPHVEEILTHLRRDEVGFNNAECTNVFFYFNAVICQI